MSILDTITQQPDHPGDLDTQIEYMMTSMLNLHDYNNPPSTNPAYWIACAKRLGCHKAAQHYRDHWGDH